MARYFACLADCVGGLIWFQQVRSTSSAVDYEAFFVRQLIWIPRPQNGFGLWVVCLFVSRSFFERVD